MKKLLEVLQYGDHDIRFNTDIDVKNNPHIVEKIIPALALTMATRLWGGNELSVLAMIRALIIADLGISVNREEMVEMMAQASKQLAHAMNEAREAMNREGIKVQVFGPETAPPHNRS
jgi:hypothetical protein